MVVPGNIALLSSGEMSDSMAEAHRSLMARLNESPRPVFVDTPAGFELNIDQIDQKAVTYFKRNFNLDLAVARYRSAEDSVTQIAEALAAIQQANYIFAGPGSPSYALRMWRESPIWQAIVRRWQEGATLVFSSAAAITLGQKSVPVYEIYKVGESPYWIDGLNLLGSLGIQAAVVPHWNNNSGDNYDTRHCYLGAPRFAKLEAMLPATMLVIGLDEYTGLCLNPITKRADVFGAGQIEVRQNGQQYIYGKGQQIDLASFASDTASEITPEPVVKTLFRIDREIQDAFDAAQVAINEHSLDSAIKQLLALCLMVSNDLERGNAERANTAIQALQSLLLTLCDSSAGFYAEDTSIAQRSALVETLVYARSELRKSKNWNAADELRNRLTALGYVVADTASGTRWSVS